MIEDIIKILETDFEWNKKNENGFSETQKMIITDTIEAIQVQARVMPNEVLAGGKTAESLIQYLEDYPSEILADLILKIGISEVCKEFRNASQHEA